VSVVEQKLYPSETEPVDVALTKVQRTKVGQMLTDKDVIKREPGHAKIKQD
jgi:hypothetical protein